MKTKKNDDAILNSDSSSKKSKFKRRDFLKGLAGLPVFGVFIYEFLKKTSYNNKEEIISELGLNNEAPVIISSSGQNKNTPLIRLGIIGFGARGSQLAHSLGFAHPDWIKNKKIAQKQDKFDSGLQTWLQQEDLNVEIAGICDVFDLRGEQGVVVSKCDVRPGNAQAFKGAKRFMSYQDMLQSKDIDAVIITTPDFHHAQMSTDAVNAGKHVYCEKCMTRTEDEAHRVYAAVKSAEKNKNIVFQVGHQYPQTEAYQKAKDVVHKKILGKITLVEATTNRNSTWGAWIRHLDANGKPQPGDATNIDWDQWLGLRPKVPFSLDRYYNWTKYWDYATGLSGQLMCHELDAINQILNLGIPNSCVASGGIYYYKDGREIPDIFNATFEFPEKELTVNYSASLSSSRYRGRVFNGNDGWMEVGGTLKVMVDQGSTRFKKFIENGNIDINLPLVSYGPDSNGFDVITSATEKYYATRGLIYTYKGGKRVDVAHLHLKEWLSGIRNGSKLSCPIDKGFEVTIACHMATKSYREKRRVEWDPVRKRII